MLGGDGLAAVPVGRVARRRCCSSPTASTCKQAAACGQVAREGWTRGLDEPGREHHRHARGRRRSTGRTPNLGVVQPPPGRTTPNNNVARRPDQRRLPAAARPDRLRRQGRSSCCTAATWSSPASRAGGGASGRSSRLPVLGLVHEPDPQLRARSTTSSCWRWPGPSACSTCWTRKPDVQDVAEAHAAAAHRRARASSSTSPSATTPSARCCTTSASRPSPGRWSRWSARPAAARAASSR